MRKKTGRTLPETMQAGLEAKAQTLVQGRVAADSTVIAPMTMVLDAAGNPVHAAPPPVVGLNVYEAPGGDDALTLMKKLAELRMRRERIAELVAAPGALTPGVMLEIRLLNQEMYEGRELSDAERRGITTAHEKRQAKLIKRAEQARRSAAGKAAQAQVASQLPYPEAPRPAPAPESRSARRKRLRRQTRRMRERLARPCPGCYVKCNPCPRERNF